MQFPNAFRTVGDRYLVGPCLALMAWLCMGLSAPPAAAQSSESPARLQALVNDSVAQLQLTYRHDPREQTRRYEQLGAAVAAWNASPQRDDDNEQMAAWLRGAIRSSMPGSRRSLPALPEFVRTPALVESTPVERTPVETAPAPEMPSVAPADDAPVATTLAKPITDEQSEPVAEPMTDESDPSEPLFGESDDSEGIDWLFGESEPATPASDETVDESADEPSDAPAIPVVPSAGLERDQADAVPPADGDGLEFGSDFWSEHPAAEPVPNDFFSGDPFRDDTPPSDE